jgi:hypothetical protein
MNADELKKRMYVKMIESTQPEPGQPELGQPDPGQHYRREHKGIKLDPARIAKIYGMTSGMMFTVLKKCLCAGNRGHKDYRQDLLDMRNAIDRELEMIDEDHANEMPKVQ